MITLPVIVLYGGSFDPVHNGHLVAIHNVMRRLHPESVHVIPSRIPPHKHPPSVANRDRLAMLRLALAPLPGVEIDEREMRRDKISYTYDTVREIRRERSDAVSLCFLIGWDAWLNFTGWHRWRDILDVVNLVVAGRPGVVQEAGLKESHQCLLSYLQQHRVSADQIAFHHCGRIVFLEAEEIELASQSIREMAANKQSIRRLVPAAVSEYIEQKQLYANCRAAKSTIRQQALERKQ